MILPSPPLPVAVLLKIKPLNGQVSHAVNYKTVEPVSGSSAENVDKLRARVKELTLEIEALTEDAALISKLQAMVDRCGVGVGVW